MTARVDALRQLRAARLACGLGGMLAVFSPAAAVAADVRVFTDRGHSVTSADGAEVIELDLPARLAADLDRDLPADPARAAAIVQRRLQDGGEAFRRRLERAYQGVTDAWTLGVAKLPAVVVDRRYVVYGVADVRRAVDSIQAARGGRP